MGTFSRLWQRFQRWLRAGLEPASGSLPLEDPPTGASSSGQTRQRLEACNQALAAALDARHRVRELIIGLARRRQLLEAELRRSAEEDDERLGAARALRLQELDAEEKELEQRLKEAEIRIDDLAFLREQILGSPRP